MCLDHIGAAALTISPYAFDCDFSLSLFFGEDSVLSTLPLLEVSVEGFPVRLEPPELRRLSVT
jgi:hypothetical protein